ncbi:MAG: T9SS type A sorting domain-containing protein [Saprospiraceae bacterium]
MKSSKIILLATTWLFFFVQNLSAQQPYMPTFKQADPIWQHVLVNPLFQHHPKGSLPQNSYTCVSTQLTTELIVDSFLISVIPTLCELIFDDGLIVQKININTGEVLWKDILYDATIDSIGWVSYPKIIYKRRDGNIEFCGNRKIIDDNIQIFDQSYRAVYDFETGQRTLYYDKSDEATYPDKIGSLNGTYYQLIEDSLYLKSYFYYVGGEEPERGLSFCLVNAAHDSIQFIKTIIMDPQMPVHRYTFRAIRAIEINDSIYAVLLNLEAPQGSSFAGKNILYLFNYKDINNIQLVKSIDITEYAIYDWRPGGVPGSGLKMNVFDEKIFVMGIYFDTTENEQFNYMLIMDTHGKVLDYNDKIKDTDNVNYSEYKPIHISDTLQLFWAYKSKKINKHVSFDIVKMNDKKEMEYVASFFPVGDDYQQYFNPHNALFIGKRLIISGLYVFSDELDENVYSKWTSYILAFDLDDLIKGSTTVSTSDPIGIGEQVVVYPNPTLDKLYLQGVENILNVDIYDSQGKMLPTNQNGFDTIDMEMYPQGIYFIKIQTKENTKTLRIIKK